MTDVAPDELADRWQIEDSHGLTVVTGVWTPFNGDPCEVGIATFDEGARMLSPHT